MPISWLTVLKAVPWGDVISNAPVVVDGARKLWNNVGRKGDTAPGPAQPTAAATDTCAAPTDTATALAQLRARRATLAIGFAYEAQCAEALPLEATDQPLDMVVTERRVIEVSG